MAESDNQVSGTVSGSVVQVGSLVGNVNFIGRQITVPRQLPPDIRRFVARTAELGLLSAGGKHGVIISGMGGVGKTALAVRWCHQARDSYTGGDLYVDLQGFGPKEPISPMIVLEGFLRALGVPARRIPAELDQRSALYRSLLHERQVLVLLDNAGSSQQVRPLLPGSFSSLAVITSRSTLATLVALNDFARIELSTLASADGIDLLREIIGPQRVDAAPSAASVLVEVCGGLPLAIRIVGERLVTRRYFAVSEAIEELSAMLDSDGDENIAVHTVFSWSYRTLAPELKRAFQLLGVYPFADLDLDGVTVFLGAAARPILEALADLHLVERVSPNIYRFHDLVRDYARECASESGLGWKAESERLLTWYLREAERVGRVLSASLPGISTTSEVDLPSWTWAARWRDENRQTYGLIARLAHDHGFAPLTRGLGLHVARVFRQWQSAPEWLADVVLNGLAAARELGDREAEGWLHWNLSKVHKDIWELDAAAEDLATALDLFRELNDRRGEGWMLHELSIVQDLANEPLRSFDTSWQAVQIFHDLGDSKAEAVALKQLGRLHSLLEQPAEAFFCLSRALTIYQRLGVRSGEAHVFYSIASVYHMLDQYDESIRCYRWALRLVRSSENREYEGWILYYIGSNYRDTEQNQDALRWFEQALTVFEQNADQWGRAWLLLDFSNVHLRLSQRDIALGRATESLRVFRTLADMQGEGAALSAVGKVHAHMDEFDRAHAYHDLAIEAARRTKNRHSELWAIAEKGDSYASQGLTEKAIDCYVTALTLARMNTSRFSESRILKKLAAVSPEWKGL